MSDASSLLPPAPAPEHLPVLVAETLALLKPQPGERYLDCTLGLGGHALEIARMLGPTGQLWAIDRDPQALTLATAALKVLPAGPQLHLHHATFSTLRKLCRQETAPRFDMILADFGASSMQFDDPQRGFSFRYDAPLDMRMDPTQGESAADLINESAVDTLAQIFYDYGEERKSRQIAAAIVRERTRTPITTTGALADLCARVIQSKSPGHQRIHPATRVFQALRIAVNQELTEIDALLDAIPDLLAPDGSAAFISFHSLEDRKVKERLKFWRQSGRCRSETRKPIQASPAETHRNPRSRSAKLRGFSGWSPAPG